MNNESKAGPVLECTVKSRGFCCGGRCALHGACPHEKAILEESAAEEADHGG